MQSSSPSMLTHRTPKLKNFKIHEPNLLYLQFLDVILVQQFRSYFFFKKNERIPFCVKECESFIMAVRLSQLNGHMNQAIKRKISPKVFLAIIVVWRLTAKYLRKFTIV